MAATEFTDVKGFLPMEEAEKLRQWAILGARVGPLLEIGSYCGLSTLHLADSPNSDATSTATGPRMSSSRSLHRRQWSLATGQHH